MKKLILSLITIVVICSISVAQHGSAEQKSAYRTVSDIEDKLLADKSDTTAIRLITEHNAAKKAMQSRLFKAEGYGKINKDKPSIEKFKLKLIKKDARFAALNEKEIAADKAKKDYISSIDPRYKAALPIAFQ